MLDHAIHNESLNNLLIENGSYNDWVITTAFYSSIHFIEHKLFSAPFSFLNTTVNSLDMAHAIIPRNNRKSRHETRSVLVNLRMFEIHVQYEFLRKQSQNARYNNYKVSNSLTEQSKNCLNAIKEYCTK